MRRKRIMLVGAGRSGKSTLGKWLDQELSTGLAPGTDPSVWDRRTPALVYRGGVIEAPGAYLESPWMRNHLIAAAQDAWCVLTIADVSGTRDVYPPGFAQVFRVPVLGVVAKCDLAQDTEAPDRCEHQLARAGIRGPFHRISIFDTESLEGLKKAMINIYEK